MNQPSPQSEQSQQSQRRQKLLILAVIAIGVLLAALILLLKKPEPAGDEPGHGHGAEHAHDASHDSHAEEPEAADHHDDATPKRGPHGGKLFTRDGYGVEVTIFEEGVPPQFRLYTYRDGKPLAPAESELKLVLERLGQPPQEFSFTRQQDYFKGNAVVEEPHSFTVTIHARHDNKPYRFSYSQEEARVSMSDQQLQQNGVTILTAGPARIQSTLQLIGEVHLNEDRTVHVVPRLAGLVESVAANAGDRVRKGQVLAVLSSQALADQRSELVAAQQRLALAKSTYAREKTLWEEKISAAQDYQQARAAYEEAQIAAQSAQQKLAALGNPATAGNLTHYTIRAPIDGVITRKNIAIGSAVKEDAEIFVISDLSSVWVEATVRAQDLPALKTGQAATIKATAFAAETSGKIAYISAVVGEQNRTATARIVLPNPEGLWRPGLPVEVSVVANEVEVPVAVAVDGLQTLRDWQVVFGRYGELLEARPLELGRSDGKRIEVRTGLRAGERYAAQNSYLIKAELGKASASHDH